jgi:putative flavoprotein involved in K+ transport
MSARKVVIATGPNLLPRIPVFAHHLDVTIHLLHPAQYRNANSKSAGEVIVVGSGISGVGTL